MYQKDWEQLNKEYMEKFNQFLDVVDNVEDEKLRLNIIYKMLRCHETLTKTMEKEFEKKV